MSKVLVVDDEKNIRDALQEFLTDEGYEVSLAEDGKIGLEKFKTDNYDIVFMDIQMPGIDGIETFRQMKQVKPQTKIVIISGMPDDATFDRALSISPGGVEGFLPKPFKPDDIRTCLKKVLAGEKLPFKLNQKQSDALTKLGNTCTENAAAAFKQVLQVEVKIEFQKIDIVPFTALFKEETAFSAVLTQKLSGEVTGSIVGLILWEDGLKMIDVIEKRPLGITKTYDEKVQTLLKATGNILSGAYINAITQLLKLSTQPSMLQLTFGKKKDIFDSLIKEFSSDITQAEYIFVVETVLSIVSPSIAWDLLLIPNVDSLKTILHKLGALE